MKVGNIKCAIRSWAVAKIIAVCNQKGGVGKTTTSVNLSASLVTVRKSVLMVDLDPQGNATMGSGIDKNQLEYSIYDLLADEASIETCIHETAPGYDLLPANGDLTGAEVLLLNEEQKEFRLKRALKAVSEKYDYVIIDCPPSLNMLTVNALVASDSVVIPMQCEYYALEGLAALMGTIEKIRQVLNPSLHIEGLLRTMFDPRNSLSNDVSKHLMDQFPDKVFRTIIPRNVRLAEAPSHGVPVILYDKRSRGAVSYLALAGELLRKGEAGVPLRESKKERLVAETA